MTPQKNPSACFLISIDVEEWFQVENLRNRLPPAEWGRQPSRIEHSIQRLLELFAGYPFEVRATFFVLGWVAERHPQLIREIQKQGHEIASHGYAHLLCGQMTPAALALDLKKSRHLLEDISGQRIYGYRAPSFSVDDVTLAQIQAAGYTYDSSYNSFDKHGRYGRITTDDLSHVGIALRIKPDFYELPVSNLQILNQTVPWGGGGYFRLLPPLLFNKGVRALIKRRQAYLFYMHPWEIDPGQPRIKGANTWRHYLNLAKTYSRLARMIAGFKDCSFITCNQYLSNLHLLPR